MLLISDPPAVLQMDEGPNPQENQSFAGWIRIFARAGQGVHFDKVLGKEESFICRK